MKLPKSTVLFYNEETNELLNSNLRKISSITIEYLKKNDNYFFSSVTVYHKKKKYIRILNLKNAKHFISLSKYLDHINAGYAVYIDDESYLKDLVSGNKDMFSLRPAFFIFTEDFIADYHFLDKLRKINPELAEKFTEELRKIVQQPSTNLITDFVDKRDKLQKFFDEEQKKNGGIKRYRKF